MDVSSAAQTPDAARHYFGRPLGLVGIVLYKAVWGTLETLSGILVFFSFNLLIGELLEDPQDQLVHWIIVSFHPTKISTIQLGLFLIVLGVMKILIAVGLWHRRAWIVPMGQTLFGCIAVYGVIRSYIYPTPFLFFALAMDLWILWYFLAVLPKHLSPRDLIE